MTYILVTKVAFLSLVMRNRKIGTLVKKVKQILGFGQDILN